MAKPGKRPRKHKPQRTCVGCREVQAKQSLIRIVRTPDGTLVDRHGKLNGRGAYLHDMRSCWEKGLAGKLAHALKTKLTADDIAHLEAYLEIIKPATETEIAQVD